MTKQELNKMIQANIRALYTDTVDYETFKKQNQKLTRELYRYKKEVALNG